MVLAETGLIEDLSGHSVWEMYLSWICDEGKSLKCIKEKKRRKMKCKCKLILSSIQLDGI